MELLRQVSLISYFRWSMPGSLINVLLTGANNDQHAAGIGTARLPGDHRLLGRCNWYPFFSVVFSQSRVVSSSLPRFISHPATGALASSADSDEEELFVGFRTVPGGSRAPRYCRRSILSLSRFFLFFLPFVPSSSSFPSSKHSKLSKLQTSRHPDY